MSLALRSRFISLAGILPEILRISEAKADKDGEWLALA